MLKKLNFNFATDSAKADQFSPFAQVCNLGYAAH